MQEPPRRKLHSPDMDGGLWSSLPSRLLQISCSGAIHVHYLLGYGKHYLPYLPYFRIAFPGSTNDMAAYH